MLNRAFPTQLAIKIAENFGVIDTENKLPLNMDMNNLAAFQQMAVACSLEDAMVVYYDYDLTEEHTAALKLIHKSTVPWLTGHVIGDLLNFCKGDTKASELILNKIMSTNPEVADRVMGRLVIGLAKED